MDFSTREDLQCMTASLVPVCMCGYEGPQTGESARQRSCHRSDMLGEDLYHGDPDHGTIAKVEEENVEHCQQDWQPAEVLGVYLAAFKQIWQSGRHFVSFRKGPFFSSVAAVCLALSKKVLSFIWFELRLPKEFGATALALQALEVHEHTNANQGGRYAQSCKDNASLII